MNMTANYVQKDGDQWCIYSKDGERLECKSTESEAKKRLSEIEYFAGNTLRVNLKAKVNAKKIRREKRNGRDTIIVPSATLPDNVIMNGGLYPAEEIEKSYKGLERTPAPLGHPVVNDIFVSSREAEAINGFWVGAHNENVRRENGRVLLDKVIDVEVANRTEKGRDLIKAIEKGDPIHTSTGIYLEPEPAEGDGYEWIARNMQFDHDAILMDEEGAATPDDGVGMMVNSQGEMKQVKVLNGSIEEYMQDDIDMAAGMLVERIEEEKRRERSRNLKERISRFLKDLMGGSDTGEMMKNANQDEGVDPMITEEQYNEMGEKVSDLQKQMDSLLESIQEKIQASMKDELEPMKEQVNALQANVDAQQEAEKNALVEQVSTSGLMKEETAKELSLNALKELATNHSKPGKADNVHGIFANGGGSEDDLSDELPGAEA